ncbi:VPLPA-CTERM-specific exosortase XrtD [Marinobacter salicampi]|uniref:VPLPA-CTERM-specific exosortase XrtD n=1 Tax=Marinobacter salicampi TaxID=435907 RepID=UPI00140A3F77|nr:VPLPA-CTERM-specific exosortase XrtD [Marinobacter salicampi]
MLTRDALAEKSWPKGVLTVFLLGLGMVGLMFQSGLLEVWIESEEYSHGPLVLGVLAYIVYCKRDSLPFHERHLDGRLIALACVPLLAFVLGAASGIGQLQKHAVWMFAALIAYASGGVPMVKFLAVPLLIALMTIPLPKGLELALTGHMQLLSSQIGVWFIRQFGGVVHLQGNIIDMGSIQLLVDEACAGLRYLYPLLGLSGIAAYLFRATLWAKWALFFAAIPITILMNSFRIGVTGILVEHYGLAHTTGFLHFFEGWVVFLAAIVVLILFALGLLAVQRKPLGLMDAFSLDPVVRNAAPALAPGSFGGARQSRRRAMPMVLLVIAGALVFAPVVSLRAEIEPERFPLAAFPLELDGWIAQEHRLPLIVEEVAGATDYYYADFSSSTEGRVNLYLSYYASQRNGKIPHSPLVCMPGDGWTITSLDPVSLPSAARRPFEASRLVITKGNRTILAYYWLKQGDNNFRQDSLARLDLVRSSISEKRTDGGLIRLLAELEPGETLAEVDQRLVKFAGELTQVLSDFVPD